jgi:hypothetical protein
VVEALRGTQNQLRGVLAGVGPGDRGTGGAPVLALAPEPPGTPLLLLGTWVNLRLRSDDPLAAAPRVLSGPLRAAAPDASG